MRVRVRSERAADHSDYLRDRKSNRYGDSMSDDDAQGANGMDVDSDDEIYASGRTTARGRRQGGHDAGEAKRSGLTAEKLTGAARRAAKAKAAAANQRLTGPYGTSVTVRNPTDVLNGVEESSDGSRKKRSFFATKAPFALVPTPQPEGGVAVINEDWTQSGGRSRAASPMSVV